MRKLIVFTIMAFLSGGLAYAQEDASLSKPSISSMRLARFKATAYLGTTFQATAGELGPAGRQHGEAILAAMKAAGIMPTGGPIYTYHGYDPIKPMTVEIGYPVADDVAATGDFHIGHIESQLTAAAVYTGPLAQLNPGRLYSQIIAAGHEASDVIRVRGLYFEGENSPNNMVLIEIPLNK